MTKLVDLQREYYSSDYSLADSTISSVSESRATPPGGAWIPGASSTSLLARTIRTVSGCRIKGFKKLVSQGLLMPYTPWEKYSLDVAAETDTWLRGRTSAGVLNECRQSPGGMSVTGSELTNLLSGLDPRLSYADFIHEATEQARTDLQYVSAQLYEDHRHDTLTFLAEFHKVKRMFENLLTRVLTLDLPRNITSLSSLWLEYRYGWRPLIYDAQSIGEALAELHSNNDKRRRNRVKGRVITEFQTSSSVDSTLTGSCQQGVVHRTTIDTTWKFETRALVAGDISLQPFSFNPPLTAWELVPYSFVIDWFLNVGQAIAAVSFDTFATEYTSAVAVKVTGTRAFHAFVFSKPAGQTANRDLEAEAQSVYLQRLPVQIPFLPRLNLNSLDLKKYFDLLSLAMQRLTR